jgi:hypothetical protein
MSAVICHPKHMEKLGGYAHAHFWLDRGMQTTFVPGSRFAHLMPVPPIRKNNVLDEVVALFRPNYQRFPR